MGRLGFSERKRYIGIFNGRIAVRVKEHTEGAIRRVNKLQKEVWELHYDIYEGVVTNILKEVEAKFGPRLVIECDHSDVLQVPWSSRYTKSFLACVPNLELDAPVTFRPYRFTPDDKPDKVINGWTIMQGKSKVPEAYDRTELPDLKQVIVKGAPVWDDTELLDFLWREAMKVWSAKIHGTSVPAALSETLEAATDADDVPF